MDNDKRNWEGDRFGWAVCIAGVFLNLFRNIPPYCFGVFIAEFKRIYDRPMVELDWIGVLAIFLTDILTPLPTMIIQRAGMKGYMICSLSGTLILTFSCLTSSVVDDISWLFLTFSSLNGLGSSLIFISSTLVVSEFFPSDHKYHLLATSLFQCSYPITILVFTPFYAWIITISSWRIGFIVQGAKMFVSGIICSLVFFKINENATKKANFESNVTETRRNKWLDIFKTPERVFWLCGIMLTVASHLVPVVNLPHYMEEKGYKKVESSIAVAILGLAEILTYVIVAPLSSKFKDKLLYLNVLSSFALAVLMFIWPLANPTYGVIMIFSTVLGISGTIAFVFVYATSKEVMDMDINVAWTSTCFFMGFGSIVNPLMSGLIFDLKDSYDDVFYTVGGVGALNGLNYCVILLIQHFKKTKNVTN